MGGDGCGVHCRITIADRMTALSIGQVSALFRSALAEFLLVQKVQGKSSQDESRLYIVKEVQG